GGVVAIDRGEAAELVPGGGRRRPIRQEDLAFELRIEQVLVPFDSHAELLSEAGVDGKRHRGQVVDVIKPVRRAVLFGEVFLVIGQPVFKDVRVFVTISDIKTTPHHVPTRGARLSSDPGREFARGAICDLDFNSWKLFIKKVQEDVQIILGHGGVENELARVSLSTTSRATGKQTKRC